MEATVLKVKEHTLLVVSSGNNFFVIKKPQQFVSSGYKVKFNENDILVSFYEIVKWNLFSMIRKFLCSFLCKFKKSEADLELTLDGFTSIRLGLTKKGQLAYVQPLNEGAKVYEKEISKWKNHSFVDALEAFADAAINSGVNINEEEYALTFYSLNNTQKHENYFLEKKILNFLKVRYEEQNLCISIFKTEESNYSANVSFVRYSIAKSLGKNLNDGFIVEKSLKELKKELGTIKNLPGYIGEVI